MSDPLTRALADALRSCHPALCRALDAAIQDGYRPEEIQAALDAETARVGHAPVTAGLVNAYLCDIDPDFRRAEDERAAAAWRLPR